MTRVMAALVAVVLLLPPRLATAAAPPEPAAAPFPVVPLAEPPQHSHLAAWSCLAAGVGLIAGSFAIHETANRHYDDYLTSSDVTRLDDLYHQTVNLDRLSSGTLLAGEGLLAAGVYLRFLRSPAPARLSVALGPGACVARLRF